jgi:hypothetical protein
MIFAIIGKIKIKWYLAFIILGCVHVIDDANTNIARIPRMDSIISWTCWIWAFVIAVRVGLTKRYSWV